MKVFTAGPKKLHTEKALAHKTKLIIATAGTKTGKQSFWEPKTVDELHHQMHTSICVPGATYPVKLGDELHGDGFFSNPVPIAAVAQYNPTHVLIIVNGRLSFENRYSKVDQFIYEWLYRHRISRAMRQVLRLAPSIFNRQLQDALSHASPLKIGIVSSDGQVPLFTRDVTLMEAASKRYEAWWRELLTRGL